MPILFSGRLWYMLLNSSINCNYYTKKSIIVRWGITLVNKSILTGPVERKLIELSNINKVCSV